MAFSLRCIATPSDKRGWLNSGRTPPLNTTAGPPRMSWVAILAAMLVNDPMVRCAFERIGWVSVGQTPHVKDLQRDLFEQLTGQPMVITDGASVQTQLDELRSVCKGKRWLIVLDDVWDVFKFLENCNFLRRLVDASRS